MTTKLQRDAKRMIDKAEREDGATVKVSKKKTGTKKRKPWRTRVYKKVARKHPVVAVPAWIFVALVTLVGKGTKWSSIGVARGSRGAGRAVSRRLASRVKADLNRRKWTTAVKPADGPRPKEHYHCCGQSHHSTQALNHHMLSAHRGERRSRQPGAATLQVAATAKHAGKTLVLDAEKGGGRHRASHRLPGARTVDDIVKQYRPQIITIGVSVMAVESTVRKLRQAAAAFGTQTPKPQYLQDLRAICVGMEIAMGTLSEAIDEFNLMLKKPEPSGANIAAELVNPFMNRARDHADRCGREFTRLIAAFEVYYGPAIRAAQNGNGMPNVDLSKTG